MAVILWVVVLCLLRQSFSCAMGQTETRCQKWERKGENICCEICSPGHRLVSPCGSSLRDLCTPCEHGTYADTASNSLSCQKCRHCVGVFTEVKACTALNNAKCRCIDELTCGDASCSFCVEKCGKGQEPTKDRSCRPCPEGYFNDKDQEMCKPWRTKCPNDGEYIVVKGTVSNDIKCANASANPSYKPNQPDISEQPWPIALSVVTITLIGFIIIIIIITMAVKILQKKKKTKKIPKKTPIIRPPTDDPRTLIAIECSFHEAQQEQGSSTESLDSKESSDQLIP